MKHYSVHKPIRHGLTLIEVLMVVSLLVVVGIVLNTSVISFYRNNAYLLEETQALNSAHNGVDNVIRTTREASYGDDGSYPISVAATSSMTIYSDIDKDSAVEKITYQLIGTTLYRTTINSGGSPVTYVGQPVSTSTLATSVRNSSSTPLFTYYDSLGVLLSSTSTPLAKIASIQIQLLTDLNPLRAPNVFTLSEHATLRNLRTN